MRGKLTMALAALVVVASAAADRGTPHQAGQTQLGSFLREFAERVR